MKTRRVGSISCGILLIVFGVLFLVHMFLPAVTFDYVMKLWPIILISLGLEMLVAGVSNKKQEEELLKYDKGAIVIVFLLTCFAIGMGCLEFMMQHWNETFYF